MTSFTILSTGETSFMLRSLWMHWTSLRFPRRSQESSMKYEEPLDCEQRAAVEASEKAIAVLAGPGSGKTRVLSYRARHLLQQDRDTKALLLTFTNKAAAEMKARALDVAVVTSDRIWASTFHT